MTAPTTSDNLHDRGATLALLIDGDNASPRVIAGLLVG
jgi:hypothetical protein